LNEGYLLLGDIVERVSGFPFEDYVKQHIFTPLGMTRSFFSQEELNAQRDKTTPHIIHAEGQTPAPYPMRMLTAAGGILSNVRDLANYVQMYLNQGSFNGQQLAKPESIATMYEKRIKSPAQGGDFGQSYYGYGLGMLDDVFGSPMYGHGGSVGVCTSYMAWLPAHGIGAVVLTNGTGYATSAFAIAALATALGKDPYELPFAVRDRRMQQLTGTYRGYKDTIESRISRAGDFLLVINKDKYGEATTPLIFDRIEGNQHIYYTLAAGSRMDAVFTVHENGDIDFLFERYLTKKVR
jgi:CubicO group peptidase (beta-lactamase class C family)